MYLGIDVAAACFHCVAIDDNGRPLDTRLVDATDVGALAQEFRAARVVALDAPSGLSREPHLDDPDPKLSAKFRVARCAEVALGRDYGVWVPWVAPSRGPAAAWMKNGFRAFAAFQSVGAEVIEVYPHAAFRAIAGALPPKRSASGLKARVRAVTGRGVPHDSLEMWSHDGLDALIARRARSGSRSSREGDLRS